MKTAAFGIYAGGSSFLYAKVSCIPETLVVFINSFLYAGNYCAFRKKFLVYWKLLRYFCFRFIIKLDESKVIDYDYTSTIYAANTRLH